MRALSLALLLVAAPLAAEKISPEVFAQVLAIGDRLGVPRSVNRQLMHEESEGDATIPSKEESHGYHSRGLFQLWEEPKNITYLVNTFWYGAGHPEPFDILNPIHNATVGLGYLASLHVIWGNWYLAACHYNGMQADGRPSAETRAYALRIVRAP